MQSIWTAISWRASAVLRLQDIADKTQRMYDALFAAGAQFPSQHMDVYFNIVGIGGGIGSPDSLEDDCH
jgi:hypothetical protein